jgi:hypothetical protein
VRCERSTFHLNNDSRFLYTYAAYPDRHDANKKGPEIRGRRPFEHMEREQNIPALVGTVDLKHQIMKWR